MDFVEITKKGKEVGMTGQEGTQRRGWDEV